MSDGRVPSPDFDATRYERPNKNWVCGHACDGCPCRIGPGPTGGCRATTECTPQLVLKEGETKGTWKCTRPKDWGGPCETGPLPDGTCCKAIVPCTPVRSLRARRGLVTRIVVLASVAGLLVGLAGPLRRSFINPGPLSLAHSGAGFERRADERDGGAQGCAACHAEAREGFAGTVAAAVGAARASLSPTALLAGHPKDFSRMDASCAACHPGLTFHQPNVVGDASCSACHLEHQGAGPLPPVADRHCAACHGDEARMLASAGLGRPMPTHLFARDAGPGLVVPPVARPADGHMQVITRFAADHPEFQVLREKHADTNPLRFNHRLHLAGDAIPPVDGRPLSCTDCHRPDASGAFMQRITFEQNCRSCHALNFDERNPGMQLPHGDATYVRAYLRSLPVQYANHALRDLGLTRDGDVAAFVQEQMARLRARTLSGENLERAVFLADDRTGDATIIAGMKGADRARFAGCALCHDVVPQGDATPLVVPPRTPDRWLPGAKFNHAKHTAVACASCHAAEASELTTDVLLPAQQSCVTCHGPKGGVSQSCTTCHGYHNPAPSAL